LRKILEVLARDLEERGEIDLQECFIDGSFSGAKKGGLESAKPSAARERSSWQWQTLMVFQSPSTQEVLRHMKSPLSRKLSNKIFSLMLQNDSLVTDPLNIAEACGKPSPKDRANRYAIARGSALECGAILDALLTLSLLPESAHSKAKILLVRIASMLSKLSRPVP
jgi:hypothetical protein